MENESNHLRGPRNEDDTREKKADGEATTTPKKSMRGFASMTAEKQREIASKGGHAAHAKGTAHEFSSDEARAAGRKGGEAVSRDRAHMAAIGRAGGHNSHRTRRSTQRTTSETTTNNDTTKRGEDDETRTATTQARHVTPQNDTHHKAS